ncbi:MAG: hypothetical protein E7057_00150 [Lentisphaerae bacterium]|nr:hypothetical protein [Lentisphaerota bacterium]
MRRFFLALMIFLLTGERLPAVSPDSEIIRLERENRELKEKLLRTERELDGFRMWLGNIAFDHTRMIVSDRERQVLLVMEELARRGNGLSMAALAVSDECRKLLSELPLGPARKAQVELRLGELEKAAMNFAGLTIPDNSDAGSCRVLAVNRDLKVAVISAGSNRGVFPGMIFSSKQNPSLKLRVIGTRLEGSVAEIISGEPHAFSAGMEMSALQQRPVRRERIFNF